MLHEKGNPLITEWISTSNFVRTESERCDCMGETEEKQKCGTSISFKQKIRNKRVAAKPDTFWCSHTHTYTTCAFFVNQFNFENIEDAEQSIKCQRIYNTYKFSSFFFSAFMARTEFQSDFLNFFSSVSFYFYSVRQIDSKRNKNEKEKKWWLCVWTCAKGRLLTAIFVCEPFLLIEIVLKSNYSAWSPK